MTINQSILCVGIVIFLGSVALTACVKKIAVQKNFVDRPNLKGHKQHRIPVALGGGIVIYLLTIVPLAIGGMCAYWFNNHLPPTWLPAALVEHIPGLAGKVPAIIYLIISGTILHVTGLLDDKSHLGPMIKLAIQIIVALLLTIGADIRLNFFIHNIVFSTTLSVVWILIIINSFNFLDNMDGLSAGIATICATILLSCALRNEQVFVSGMLVLLIGALGGFLIFNFNPAKIYMGDAGSLLVGMLIAVGTILTTYYHQAQSVSDSSALWVVTFMPIIVLAVPLYDFISVVIIRLILGVSPFKGDNRHFSHRLVKRGMSVKQSVCTIYLVTACTGLGAILLQQLNILGAILLAIQTMMMLLVIAILEKPLDHAVKKDD
jgi:UDP-GlcNAc:undecaprenyl-phosphate GlcNAc-1-phosphate transferase